MPYTGNLLQQQQAPDSRPLPGPSPRHGTDEGDPALSLGQTQVPAGTGSEYQGTDYAPVVMSGFGMPLDNPASWAGSPPGGQSADPYRITYPDGNPHDSCAVLSHDGADVQAVTTGLRHRAHDGAEDRGWLRTGFDPAPLFPQDRVELATQGMSNPYGVLSDDGVKYVRGINSRPENNPPREGYVSGYRPGRERVRAWDNADFASVSRVIGVQVLRPRDAYTPNASRRMFATAVVAPALPRDAVAPDDVAYARADYVSAPTSVFGGF